MYWRYWYIIAFRFFHLLPVSGKNMTNNLFALPEPVAFGSRNINFFFVFTAIFHKGMDFYNPIMQSI